MRTKHFSTKASVLSAVVISFGMLALAAGAPAFQTDKLAGVANFRDIGGYKTSDGQQLKRNVIFRSGELSGTTPQDQKFLNSLHIRYEIDLRTDMERKESPTRWGGNPPKVISVSVGRPRNSDVTSDLRNNSALQNEAQAKTYMAQTTARIAIDGAADIGEVLRRLAEGDEPALIHCSAGKDRTGVTVAVLMTLLQVPRDQVSHEYVRSNEATDQQIQRAKAREQGGATSFRLTDYSPAAQKMLLSADASYLEAAFAAIDKQYGSFDEYTKNGLKITPHQIRALRARLLEPAK